MASDVATKIPTPGFSFDNCLRNAFLASKGFPVPKARKTGTTIVGCIYKDGVVLGSDTRATADTTIADKNCHKIHYLAPNMYCCGAGTAADTFMVTKMISSQLELHRLATDRVVPVCTANRMLCQHLFKYQGHVGAALIVGGLDLTGPKIYSIHPHGSSSFLPYTTMGSGSLAAMATLENGWKPDMTLEEAKALVRDAVSGGIFNDLGSGSNVDLCIITKVKKNDKEEIVAELIRAYEVNNMKGERQGTYNYRSGTTAVLSEQVRHLEVVETIVRPLNEDSMDTSQ